ncbi:putative long-chain-fatty-acid--CoA ligase [Triangularia verruculosa]|uniref:Long-chain-fatty-acid--CoA ligase n=1 Tax=Triangularia verruculosa TaxID=2587418 RepID=A0AAN6XCG8_9PEZI|nr:putative long-chain-fatty-acid--CoA ligase [Triangularia verruculosa]
MAPSKQDTTAYINAIAQPPPPGTPYALPIPGTERPNRTPIYRHWRFQNGPLLETFDPAIRTIHDLFEASVARVPRNRCLGHRPWNVTTKTWENKFVWTTYADVAERRKNLGAGIVELHQRVGVTADQKYAVGLWSQNRPEWQITELALLSQALWPVSLYETLGPEATEYIINHSELTAVVCSLPHIPTLLKLAPRVPTLKFIISLDPLDAGEMAGHSKLSLLNAAAAQVGLEIFSMEDVEALGARSGRPMRPPQPEDVLTINYTSGTTGDPKGVLLTHANGVAGISAARANQSIAAGDVHLSYLPLAHIYGRMADQTALTEGASIGYFHGDITKLVEDIKLLRPTGLMSVPRLFNRINSAIQAATVEQDGFKGALSRRVIDAKKASMKLPPGKATNKHFLYDKIWTPKVLKGVGLSRARTMVSGSAQLDPDVHEFLRAAFGNNFVQGFGMTETYAVGTVQMPGDFTTGNIGPPCPSVELCIESVPDYEYTVEDKPNPRGELLMRGPIIFKEYYRNPEETAKTIETDGWFHTGDIVEVDSMGRFKIIDRKKNVLKLAQGEYISPERIENVYLGSCNLLAMAFVHGEPKESSLVAVFGIDPVQFAPYASKILKQNIPADDKAALKVAGNDPRVKSALLKLLDQIGKSHKFNSYEKVKNIYLDIEPFSIENELLTPTLKLKRPQTARAFRAEIERMYEEIAANAGAKPKL